MNSLLTRHPSPQSQETQGKAKRDWWPALKLPSIQLQFHRHPGLLAKIGLFGSIAWAIVVPTLLGLSLGLWIDTMYPSEFSWVSFLLPIGLFLGCLNAGYWFRQDFTTHD